MTEDNKNAKDTVKTSVFNTGLLCNFNRIALAYLRNKAMAIRNVLSNKNGFLSSFLIAIFIMFLFITTTILAGVTIGAKNKATASYMWFSEAMNFAAQAANISADTNQTALNTQMAETYFKFVFSQITNTTSTGTTFVPQAGSPYPGTIALEKFIFVNTGDPIPGGVAQQPGFLAQVDVPVLGGNLPLVGNQYVTTPMEYFAVVKSTNMQQ